MLARRSRLLVLVSSPLACMLALPLAGCPAPQSPKGPPPEYEEPAPPSWLAEAGTASGAAPEAGPAPVEAGAAAEAGPAPAPPVVLVPPG